MGVLAGTGAGFVAGMNIFGGGNAERTAGAEPSRELIDDNEAFNRLITSFGDDDIRQITQSRPPRKRFAELVDKRFEKADPNVISGESIERVKQKAFDGFDKFQGANPNFTQRELKSAMRQADDRFWRARGVELPPQ